MPYNSQKIGYAGGSKTSKNAAYNDLNGKITIRRLSELKNSGLIRDSGKTKQGKWGLQITIWELT